MLNKKIAFYLMNEKGFYVLEKFIQNFGEQSILYVVSSKDKNMAIDYYDQIKRLSKRYKIKFFNKSDDYKEIEKNFNGYKFVIGWKWIISNTNNLIVFHDSLLPKYRGFAPLVNALINGEKKFGVTALFASENYDEGEIVLQKQIKIKYPIKIESLISKIKKIYFYIVKEIYLNILSNKILNSTPQDHQKATYSPWLDESDYFIDWQWNAKKIKRFIDAVGSPYAGSQAYLNGEVIKIEDADIIKDVQIQNRERHIGKIIFFKKEKPVIICKKGLLIINNFVTTNNKNIKVSFRSRFK